MTATYAVDRLLSKAFLRLDESPECELARGLLGHEIANYDRRFKLLRTGRATWETLGCGALPPFLERIPPYWSVPWMEKIRKPMTRLEQTKRMLQYPEVLREFKALLGDMERDGWCGDPVQAVALVDGDRRVYQFLDGNRRIGIAAALDWTGVPLTIRETFDWERTLSVSKGRFSVADTARWWRHAFRRVYEDA